MRLVKRRAKKLDSEQTAKLHDMVRLALKRDAGFFKGCERMKNWLRGQQWAGMTGLSGHSRVTVNLAHSHTRSLLPSLFFKEPYIEARPLEPHHEQAAPVWEGLINAVYERTDYKSVTKEIVLDSIVYPEGWKKWIYKSASTSDEVESGENPMGSPEDAAQATTESNQTGPNNWVENAPIGVRLSPTQVIPESKSRRPEDSRFIAIRYKKLLSELEVDPRYKLPRDIKDRIKSRGVTKNARILGTDIDRREDNTIHAKGVVSEDDVEVDLYEIWVHQIVDLKLYKQVVCILDDITDEPVRGPIGWEEFVGPHLDTYPINKVEINPIPDGLPVSELEVWKSLQQTINWVTSRLVAMVENQKQFYNVYPNNAKNPEKVMNQVRSTNVREFIEATGDNSLPVIEPVLHNKVPNDNYNLIQVIEAFLQRVSGIGQNRRGSAGVRTATEASIIEQGTENKEDEKVDTVAEFLKRDAEIVVSMLRNIADGDYVFRAVGDVGPVRWQTFTREMAQWSPDVVVRANSFRKATEQQRLQVLFQMWQLAIQGYQALGGQVRLDLILQRIAKESGIPNPSELIGQTTDQVNLQMAEIVLMTAGQQVPVNPTDNNRQHINTIDNFMSQPELVNALSPQAQLALEQHRDAHEQAEQQIQSSVQTGGGAPSNPFYSENGSTAQSSANQETSGDRTPIGGRSGGLL